MASIVTIAVLVLLGLSSSAQQPASTGASELRFDVVSIKENTGSDLSIRFNPQSPDGYRQSNVLLANNITYAFNIPQPSLISGLPEWTRTTRYDIAAKAAREQTRPYPERAVPQGRRLAHRATVRDLEFRNVL